MQHTYLRYECADSFSLTLDSPLGTGDILSLLPIKTSKSKLLLTCSGSQINGFNLRKGNTNKPTLKLYHNEITNIGSGKSLNSNESTCIDTCCKSSTGDDRDSDMMMLVGVGYIDGSIRIFTVSKKDVLEENGLGVGNSLLGTENEDNEDGYEDDNGGNDKSVLEEPLVLNGHNNVPIRCIKFSNSSNSSNSNQGKNNNNHGKLASGGSDGCIILWDIISETGLFRLLGHTSGITSLHFLADKTRNLLVSSSLDCLCKIWDLEKQYCCQTIANHKAEIWSTCLCFVAGTEGEEGDRVRFITGSSDHKLRVWNLDVKEQPSTDSVNNIDPSSSSNMEMDDLTPAKYMGSINNITTNERVHQIQMKQNIMAVSFHNSKIIEIHSFLPTKASEKKRKRRMKRRSEKLKNKEKNEGKKEKQKGILDDASSDEEKDVQLDGMDGKEDMYDLECITAGDEVEYWDAIRTSHKSRGFTFLSVTQPLNDDDSTTIEAKIVFCLANNAMEIHSIQKIISNDSIDPSSNTFQVNKLSVLDIYGHPTGIRSISLSNDDKHCLTCSKGSLKLWSIHNRTCIRSLPIDTLYALCCLFLHTPKFSNHVVVGTREGHLLIFHIDSGDIVSFIEGAHDAAIWNLDFRFNNNLGAGASGGSFISGSADHTVKFWDLEALTSDENSLQVHPSLLHVRTLKMNDDVLAIGFSHHFSNNTDNSNDAVVDHNEGLLVAVSTLDNTIKVFFHDTLKLFLTLYGHSLPALALDISHDDTLLISGGADKTIKIWGLDFGDAHRTLYGHDDSITNLKFVKNTHYFFSCSKDKTLKYWDADRFQLIMSFHGHTKELHALAISNTGAFVLTSGMDRQVRVWERTKDIVFLEEEKERQLEKMLDSDLMKEQGNFNHTNVPLEERDAMNDDDNDAPLQSQAAVKRSILSIESGDRIMEALELVDQEMKLDAAFKSTARGKDSITRTPNVMLLGYEPQLYILWILKSVKPAELEPSILVLPIHYVERLMHYIILLLRERRGVELCSRIAILLIKSHQNQVIATNALAMPIRELRKLIKKRLNENKCLFGFNYIALKAVSKLNQEEKMKHSFVDGKEEEVKDIWAGMGLGSDIAAAIEPKHGRKRK